MLSSRFSDIADSALAKSDFVWPQDEMDTEISENMYREAAKKFTFVTSGWIQFIRDARYMQELMMRIDIVSYVFNHPSVKDVSLTKLAKRHKTTRAAISAQILNLQRANKLPPTLTQKSEESRTAYNRARVSTLK